MKYLIFLILILSLSNLSSKEVKKYFKCEKGETKIYLYDDKIVIHCYSFENNKLRKIEIKTNSKKDLKFFKELNQSDYNFDILMRSFSHF